MVKVKLQPLRVTPVSLTLQDQWTLQAMIWTRIHMQKVKEDIVKVDSVLEKLFVPVNPLIKSLSFHKDICTMELRSRLKCHTNTNMEVSIIRAHQWLHHTTWTTLRA